MKLQVEIPESIYTSLGGTVESVKAKIIEIVRNEYTRSKMDTIQSQIDDIVSTVQSEAHAELEQITIEESK